MIVMIAMSCQEQSSGSKNSSKKGKDDKSNSCPANKLREEETEVQIKEIEKQLDIINNSINFIKNSLTCFGTPLTHLAPEPQL